MLTVTMTEKKLAIVVLRNPPQRCKSPWRHLIDKVAVHFLEQIEWIKSGIGVDVRLDY